MEHKFSEKSVKGIFVGYGAGNVYRVYVKSENYELSVLEVSLNELILKNKSKNIAKTVLI